MSKKDFKAKLKGAAYAVLLDQIPKLKEIEAKYWMFYEFSEESQQEQKAMGEQLDEYHEAHNEALEPIIRTIDDACRKEFANLYQFNNINVVYYRDTSVFYSVALMDKDKAIESFDWDVLNIRDFGQEYTSDAIKKLASCWKKIYEHAHT